jgi:hypothetical protein
VLEKKSRPAGDRAASEIVLADAITFNKSAPILQPLDDLARYRAAHLVSRFAVHPETAAALALLAFGGAHG